MFLFENVRGLLPHDSGRTHTTIIKIFEQAGYTIQKKVLNAWNFGVPQKRERLITIGIRNDLINRITYQFPKEHEYKPVLRDVLLDCPDGSGIPYGIGTFHQGKSSSNWAHWKTVLLLQKV